MAHDRTSNEAITGCRSNQAGLHPVRYGSAPISVHAEKEWWSSVLQPSLFQGMVERQTQNATQGHWGNSGSRVRRHAVLYMPNTGSSPENGHQGSESVLQIRVQNHLAETKAAPRPPRSDGTGPDQDGQWLSAGIRRGQKHIAWQEGLRTGASAGNGRSNRETSYQDRERTSQKWGSSGQQSRKSRTLGVFSTTRPTCRGSRRVGRTDYRYLQTDSAAIAIGLPDAALATEATRAK
jgi:hypothetical protein